MLLVTDGSCASMNIASSPITPDIMPGLWSSCACVKALYGKLSSYLAVNIILIISNRLFYNIETIVGNHITKNFKKNLPSQSEANVPLCWT